jgi:hypothetical protein
VSGRKGCLVGCVVALGLVLFYPLYLLASLVIVLGLGFLFPWEPPVAEDAPQEAVLRVLAPEGETYRIEWGRGFSKEIVEGEQVDPGLGYRDHPVQADAVDRYGGYNISVYAGDERTHPAGDDEVPLGAVLFVSGEYKYCKGAQSGALHLNWTPGEAAGGPALQRMICGSHRYAPL